MKDETYAFSRDKDKVERGIQGSECLRSCQSIVIGDHLVLTT